MKIHDIKKYFFPAGYDLGNPVVLRRFNSIAEEAKSEEDSSTNSRMAREGDCSCWFQAELKMMVTVDTTTSPQTFQWNVWLCEEVVCSNLCWDTGGWEKGMNGISPLGSSNVVIRLTMELAKCCDGCDGVDCDDADEFWDSYQSICDKDNNANNYHRLKDCPSFVKLMVDADGDATTDFTEAEAAAVMAAALDLLNRDGSKDPAKRDCKEIEGFCGGDDLSLPPSDG